MLQILPVHPHFPSCMREKGSPLPQLGLRHICLEDPDRKPNRGFSHTGTLDLAMTLSCLVRCAALFHALHKIPPKVSPRLGILEFLGREVHLPSHRSSTSLPRRQAFFVNSLNVHTHVARIREQPEGPSNH